MSEKITRRSLFKLALLSSAAVPFLVKTSQLFAADSCPKTAPAGKAVASSTEGMGKTLEYVADATTSKNAKYKSGSNCGKCKFYNAAKAEAGFAPCTMMGMKYVSNCGWCKSYMPKA